MKAKVSRGTDLKISRGGDLTISRGGDLTISRGADLIRSALVLVALTLSTSVVGHDGRAFAQAAASKTKADVTALASDRMEGRLTGTAGERAAGDYIISELRRIGAKPLPGNTDYRLPFEFTAGAHDGGSFVGVTQKPKITQGPRGPVVGGVNSQFRRTDVQALSFSDDAMVQGPVVFAGYGIVVPESQDFGYDSYATLDVKDKIVLVLRYFPEDADPKTKGILVALRRPSIQGAGGAAARREGAARRHRTAFAERRRARSDDVRYGARRVGNRRGEHQCESSRGDLRGFRTYAGRSAALTGFGESARRRLRYSGRHGFRTGARDPRETHGLQRRGLSACDNDNGPRGPKPWVALGAHYDHLGHGEAGNTLAGKEDAGQDSFRRRRQRVGHGGGSRRRRSACEATAAPERRAGPVVRRGARLAGLVRVRQHASNSARSVRSVFQLRHGRPHAGQQADRSGDRHEPRLAANPRAGEHRRRLRSAAAGGSVSADRRRELQPGRRAVPEFFHRHPSRLPPADRHGRQD